MTRSRWPGQGLAVALAGLLLPAAGCAPATDDRGPARRSELVARSLMAARQAADTAAVFELFRPDAVYDDYGGQTQHRGLEEILAYVTQVHAWASDVSLDVVEVHAGEATATVEWLISGVQDRPVPGGIPVATGRAFVLNGVTVLDLEGDRIVRAADYVDVLPLLLQLGGTVTLPGGDTLRLEFPEGRASPLDPPGG